MATLPLTCPIAHVHGTDQRAEPVVVQESDPQAGQEDEVALGKDPRTDQRIKTRSGDIHGQEADPAAQTTEAAASEVNIRDQQVEVIAVEGVALAVEAAA